MYCHKDALCYPIRAIYACLQMCFDLTDKDHNLDVYNVHYLLQETSLIGLLNA